MKNVTTYSCRSNNNKLHIDTTTGQTISGVIANFGAAVEINKGGSIATQWKDAALNTAAFNSTLTIAAGTGTVTFTGINTYTGPTNIGAGTLALSGAGSIAQSSVITVNSGAHLDVAGAALPFTVGAVQKLTNNGSVIGAVDVLGTVGGSGVFENGVTLESGAHLAAGNSPGTLSFGNGLTLANGSVLDFDLGTSSDLVRILAGVFDGSDTHGTTVNFTYGPGFIAGNTYTLLDWTGATATDVDASDFFWTDTSPLNSVSFTVVGSTLQATVVPEPGILGLLGIGLAAACGRRRRA